MPERLVDVLYCDKAVLHTFPITIDGPDAAPDDGEYQEKAAKAAALARLVPDAAIHNLTTRMHVSRGGPLSPYGANRDLLCQTPEGDKQLVRERAYFLWQQDGCPHGGAEDYWHRADDQHVRENAYILWQQAGCPEGRADEFWYHARAFEDR